MLEDASKAILSSWYNNAKQNVFGPNGKSREKIRVDVSDDEADDDLTHAWTKEQIAINKTSSSIAVFWLRSARARLQTGGNRDSLRRSSFK